MKWELLLSDKRFGMERYTPILPQHRSDFQRDYDRLIFSSPFRRLQNKTQVFPLPGKIFVHNRLTHSMEVASVGRSIGSNIARELRERYPSELGDKLAEMGGIVAAACLAHDMGNPPFGHCGERAIGDYFKDGEGKELEDKVRQEGGRWEDFLHFEGNANALRLLTHQFAGRRPGGFALTYATLASIVKYPWPSTQAGESGKLGFFHSEEETYHRIAAELGISAAAGRYARHPLVYAVEAADDICYQIMDIEDATKLHILSAKETRDLFFHFFQPAQRDRISRNMLLVSDENEQIAYLRASVIGLLVEECTRVFVDHEQLMLAGTFPQPLIHAISPLPAQAYERCAEVALQRIYSAKEVVDIELAGYPVFSRLISDLYGALENPSRAYSKVILRRIPRQYDTSVRSTYGRIQCVLDYISGMTDLYALDLFHKLTGTTPSL
ncbi:MAG: dNTP triphosphohydrolase [Tannerellaceae bacterium]|jgi:dGTPase|nr:dNTP triphosphohydrolase [Tannerellaceae bacterium]